MQLHKEDMSAKPLVLTIGYKKQQKFKTFSGNCTKIARIHCLNSFNSKIAELPNSRNISRSKR
jgi:hypothetical protein